MLPDSDFILRPYEYRKKFYQPSFFEWAYTVHWTVCTWGRYIYPPLLAVQWVQGFPIKSGDASLCESDHSTKKATHGGCVTVVGGPKEVSLSVHNDGVPIPKDAIGGIFEALVRGGTDGIHSANLGLGLYITKEIVSAHGGTIRVASSEKDGTTFIAIFPHIGEIANVAKDGIQPADNYQKAAG